VELEEEMVPWTDEYAPEEDVAYSANLPSRTQQEGKASTA